MAPFSNTDSALFFRLLLAHLLIRFIWPADRWESAKRRGHWRSSHLYWHGALAGLAAYLLAGSWLHPELMLLVGFVYILIDGQQRKRKASLRAFLLAQTIHLFIILLIWLYLTSNWKTSYELAERFFANRQMMAVLTGYLICTGPVGYIVGVATYKWQQELISAPGGSDTLADAGRWIGISERILILTFVLLNQYEAIGFLIAAKSLLRFREGEKAPKQSEYVLVGTLMSYGLAILIGALLKLIIE